MKAKLYAIQRRQTFPYILFLMLLIELQHQETDEVTYRKCIDMNCNMTMIKNLYINASHEIVVR